MHGSLIRPFQGRTPHLNPLRGFYPRLFHLTPSGSLAFGHSRRAKPLECGALSPLFSRAERTPRSGDDPFRIRDDNGQPIIDNGQLTMDDRHLNHFVCEATLLVRSRTSTRRFWPRPSRVLLSASGRLVPNPRMYILKTGMLWRSAR
jgi:hypothetical protein